MKFLSISLTLFALFAAALFAQEEERSPEIFYDRSENSVPLNITYDGSEILIYGAVDMPNGEDPDLVIKVIGPSSNYTVHKKIRNFGIWMNGPSMTFRNVPSFLATFSDAPLDTMILPTEKRRYNIGFEQAVPLRGIGTDVDDPKTFADAFIRLQKRDRKYVLDEDGIKVSGKLLFSARIPLAANIVEGEYDVEIYLLGRGRVLTFVTSKLPVVKTGLERWLYDMSQERGFLYGCLAIFLAISVAFLMSQIVRLFQR